MAHARPWLACGLSGALMVLAFSPFYQWWAGWLALAPAWWALRAESPIRQHPLRYGFLIGIIFDVGCFWWLALVSPMGFLIIALVPALCPALWFLLLAQLDRKIDLSCRHPSVVFLRAAAGAALWVTLTGIHDAALFRLNWNDLGVSQTPCLHLRQLAALGGVNLLTFVLAAFGILMAETAIALRRGHHPWTAAAGAAALAIATWFYGWVHLQRHDDEPPAHTLSYLAIQPDLPAIPYARDEHNLPEIHALEAESFRQEVSLSSPAVTSRHRPDLLIWPESITIERLQRDKLIADTVRGMMKKFHGFFLLDSEETGQDGKLYNTAYLVDPQLSIQSYRKMYLIVLGEYLPLEDEFPILKKIWGSYVSFNPGTSPGDFHLHDADGRPVSFSPFICFEETQADAARAAVRLHPDTDFFVTLTNDSWYSGTGAWAITQAQLQNAILRCVEHDRPLIRCANNGITCQIDANGAITARGPIEETFQLVRDIQLRPPQPTLYEAWGDSVGMICRIIAITLGITALSRPEHMRQTEKTRLVR